MIQPKKKPSGVSSTSKSSIAEAEEVEVPDILAAQIENLKMLVFPNKNM